MRNLGRFAVYGVSIMILILSGTVCKSDNEVITDTQNGETLFKAAGSGKLIIYENVDVIKDANGKVSVKMHPKESKRFDTGTYKKVEPGITIENVESGTILTNVKKCVFYEDGKSAEIIWLETTVNSVVFDINQFLILKSDPQECTDADDCEDKYGEPPRGWEYACDDGVCKLTGA